MSQEDLEMIDVFTASYIIIGVLVVLIIAFAVVYRQRILTKEIELKNKESQHQRNLLTATITAQETEQARIAKDLHDDLGALLSTVKQRVIHFEGQVPVSDEITAYTTDVKAMLGKGLESVRRIVNDLLPPVLRDFGLQAGIEELVAEVEKSSGIALHFDMNWDAGRIQPEVELPVYRMAQELLNNALKHAKAQNIWLHVLVDKEQLILEYRDDGKGFDMKAQKQNLGFKNFESRTQALNGTFEFSSQPGKGLRAFFEIPLTQNQASHEHNG